VELDLHLVKLDLNLVKLDLNLVKLYLNLVELFSCPLEVRQDGAALHLLSTPPPLSPARCTLGSEHDDFML